MKQRIGEPRGFVSFDRCSLALKFLSGAVLVAGGLVFTSVVGGALQAPSVVAADITEARAVAAAPTVASSPYGALLIDIRSHARSAPVSLAQNSPPRPNDEAISSESTASIPAPEKIRPAPPSMTTAVPLDESAPLPPPRPTEFGWLTSHNSPLRAPQHRKTALPADPSDDRTLFDRFFGSLQMSEQQPPRPVLAYAPQSGALDDAPSLSSGPRPRYDRWTAVYDIAAHTVYLPDGTRLEAHSGLGEKLDDPRYVHVRMRGATPPHVYELTLRERLFHGVQALRLTPVDGGNIFGRAGLLAHTYMLGPRGDSNGCVSFKNYTAFLRAFQSGEVKRLIVVAHLD